MERLIEALTAGGFNFDAESLLDTLWLARIMPPLPRFVRDARFPGTLGTADASIGGIADRDTKNDNVKWGDSGKAESSSPSVKRGGLYTTGGQDGRNESWIPASPIRIPAGTVLPQSLGIVRAFRPLRTRTPSRTVYELNEEATAEMTAQNLGTLSTVFQARPERPFVAALVAEYTSSMEIWSSTLVEIERVLEYVGAFRDRRTWRLHLSPKPHLRKEGTLSWPIESLCDPAARRIIFFFTHGVSREWNDGTLGRVLRTWARTTPVVLLHALPPNLWKNTALGEPAAFARNAVPGGPNTELRIERAWWDPIRKLEDGRFPVPVFHLNPKAANCWAEMFMSRRGRRAPAFLVRTSPATISGTKGKPSQIPRNAKQRVSFFRSFASPEAFRLAVHLSMGPFSVPVIHLIQSALLKDDARQSQVAEVMLSGLVSRVTPPNPNIPAERLQFSMDQEIRPILLRSLRRQDAKRLVSLLQDYIERQFGNPNDFLTWIADPNGRVSVPASAEPFVNLRTSFLDWLGVAPGVASLARLPLKGIRILWVDDHPRNNIVESEELINQGASIEPVLETNDAVSAALQSAYDVIISDMQRGNDPFAGLDLVRRLRNNGIRVPYIIYAAKAEQSARTAAERAGAFGCTNNPEELVTLVKEAVRLQRTISLEVDPIAARLFELFRRMQIDSDSARSLAQSSPENLARRLRLAPVASQLPYQDLLAVVAAVTRSEYIQLFLLRDEQICLAADSVPAGMATYAIANPGGVIGRTASSGRTHYVPDVRKYQEYVPAERSTKAELALPILSERTSNPVGVLNVESRMVDPFSADEVLWLEEFLHGFAADRAFLDITIGYTGKDHPLAQKLHQQLLTLYPSAWSSVRMLRFEEWVPRASSGSIERSCLILVLSQNTANNSYMTPGLNAIALFHHDNPDALCLIPALLEHSTPPQALSGFEIVNLVLDFERGCAAIVLAMDKFGMKPVPAHPIPNDADDLVNAHLKRARTAFETEDYDAAIHEYSTALDMEPKNLEALRGRGATFWYAQSYEKSVRDFAAALELAPNDYSLLSCRGQALAEMGNYKDALSDLDKSLRLTEENESRRTFTAYSLRARAVVYASLKEFGLAQGDFVRSMQLAPGNAWLYQSMAQVMENAGNEEMALNNYIVAIAMRDPALNSLRLNSTVDRILILIDKQNVSKKETAERARTLWLETRSRSAIAERNYPLAIGSSTLGILKWPSATFYGLRGEALRLSGLLEPALTDLNKAMVLSPVPVSRVLRNRGEIFLERRLYREAVREFESALRTAVAEADSATISACRDGIRRALAEASQAVTPPIIAGQGAHEADLESSSEKIPSIKKVRGVSSSIPLDEEGEWRSKGSPLRWVRDRIRDLFKTEKS